MVTIKVGGDEIERGRQEESFLADVLRILKADQVLA